MRAAVVRPESKKVNFMEMDDQTPQQPVQPPMRTGRSRRPAVVPVTQGDAPGDERPARHEAHGLLSTRQFWLLNLLAGAALLLVVVEIALALDNRGTRYEVSQRQQFINDSVQFSRLNSQLIQAIAEVSARTGDESLRSLLAAQGISYTVSSPSSNGSSSGGLLVTGRKAERNP